MISCKHVTRRVPFAELHLYTIDAHPNDARDLRVGLCISCAGYYETAMSESVDRGAVPVSRDSVMTEDKKWAERRVAHLVMAVLRELDDEGAVRALEGVLKLLKGE